MSWTNFFGFAAALCVLASFCMTTITALRTVALLSNVLFIIYGLLAHIHPVLLLHIVLLPVNLIKLHRIHVELGPQFKRAWRRSVQQRLELHLWLTVPADRLVDYDCHSNTGSSAQAPESQFMANRSQGFFQRHGRTTRQAARKQTWFLSMASRLKVATPNAVVRLTTD